MEQIDKLTRLLCLACWMILNYPQRKTKPMNTKWQKAQRELMSWYLGHRKLDKQRALAEANAEFEEMTARIAQIRRLGGIPEKSLLKERDKVIDRMQAIKASDPPNTELY